MKKAERAAKVAAAEAQKAAARVAAAPATLAPLKPAALASANEKEGPPPCNMRLGALAPRPLPLLLSTLPLLLSTLLLPAASESTPALILRRSKGGQGVAEGVGRL